jgi:hypothetical protein
LSFQLVLGRHISKTCYFWEGETKRVARNARR